MRRIAAILIGLALLVTASANAQTRVTAIATPQPYAPHCNMQGYGPVTGRNLARAASTLNAVFSPGPQPNQFILSIAFGWMGLKPPQPQLDMQAIHVDLVDAVGKVAERATLLGQVPEPPRSFNTCYDDRAVNLVFALAPPGTGGMYHLHIVVKALPLTLADGTTVTPSGDETMSMYEPSPPNLAPDLHVGQRYLVLPVSGIEYVDERGSTVPRANIALRVATIAAVDDDTVTAAVEGTATRLRFARSDAPMLPGMAPISDDPSAEVARAWYAGKRVWTRGGIGIECSSWPDGFTGYAPSPLLDVRVRAIYRLSVPLMELAIGPQIGASGGGRESGFEDSAPLLVVFDVRGKLQPCGAGYAFYADRWDLDRALSTQSVRALHPQWSKSMLDAIESGKLESGMTHEMVAWTIGYPAILGTREQLNTLTQWHYDNLGPFQFLVDFDTQGRVKHFGPNGELP